jgi:hypothetical protein
MEGVVVELRIGGEMNAQVGFGVTRLDCPDEFSAVGRALGGDGQRRPGESGAGEERPHQQSAQHQAKANGNEAH